MNYNLEYHKALDRSHILPNLLNGGYMGILSQMLSDIFISILLFNEAIIINDIKISHISSYYTSAIIGMLAGVLVIFLDPIATIIITTILYNYILKYIKKLINDEPIILTPISDTFDTGISVLLISLFDPTAISQYSRYQQKRHFIEPSIPRRDRTLGLIIFFSVLSSTYGWLKSQNKEND